MVLRAPGLKVPNFQTSALAFSVGSGALRTNVAVAGSGTRTVTWWASASLSLAAMRVYLSSSPGATVAGTRTRSETAGTAGPGAGTAGGAWRKTEPPGRATGGPAAG